MAKSNKKAVKKGELMDRVRADIQKTGGFALIGQNDKKNGLALSVLVHNTSKSKIIFSVAQALDMGPGEILLSLAQYHQSKVNRVDSDKK